MLEPELVELLKQLFALGGNHETLRLNEVRKKLLNFLKSEKFLLSYQDNENVTVAIDAIRFIDANNILAKTTNRIKAGVPVKPFFDRLIKLDSWSFYELKFLISLLVFTKNAEQALELASKAKQTLTNFRVINNTAISEGYLACNVCSRLLYAKYFDDDITVDLAQEFANWFSNLEQLAESNSELEVLFLATKIRRAIFNQDQGQTQELCEVLRLNYNEDIYKVFMSGIELYTRGGEK